MIEDEARVEIAVAGQQHVEELLANLFPTVDVATFSIFTLKGRLITDFATSVDSHIGTEFPCFVLFSRLPHVSVTFNRTKNCFVLTQPLQSRQ